jgi:GntR family transcriptional regulator
MVAAASDGAFGVRAQVLDRNSSTPLHIQLAERVRRLIITGEYPPGEKLNTEKAFGDLFGLSRVTVRNGLALLEREGWIVKRQGMGSFVRNPIEQDLTSVQTTSEVARAKGVAASIRILHFGAVVPPKHVAKSLSQSINQRLLLIEKLHADSTSPIALVRCFLPLEIEAEAELIRSQPSVTTISIWERKLGIRVKGAHHHIRAEPADDDVAAALELEPGAPVLMLERTSYAEDGRALEFISSIYNWRRYQFSIALPRIRMDELS